MPVIEGGNVITGGVVDEHTGPQTLHGHGAPTDGVVPTGTYAGIAAAGSFYVDHDSNDVYENTNTLASPTWVQIDTV